MRPNWRKRIGAVATPHASDTASASLTRSGIGYPSKNLCARGTATKIAATAANES